MSYFALYRKFRPQKFSDVIGQDHITATLVNQIMNDRVGHAYLFTGSRGTGKTSCAKIFAKAVNCLAPVFGSPCGECANCLAMDKASNLDIMEIDAASNNKVDEIRDLRENVKYPPVCGKFKVYIIDEVHMLTDSAYNALLKTLEEPPAHVVFILATTEVHKIPATILSRCNRFDFRLVARTELAELIKKVYDQVGKTYDIDAINYIARAGEGSVRDALSIADMCLNYKEGKLTYSDVLVVLGASDRESVRKLTLSIVANDIAGTLEAIEYLSTCGKSMSLIAKDITGLARDMLVIKSVTDAKNLVQCSNETLLQLQQDADKVTVEGLVAIVQIFSAIDMELRYSVSPRLVLEAACMRACLLYNVDLVSFEERIARLERNISNIASGGSVASGGNGIGIGTKVAANTANNNSASDISREGADAVGRAKIEEIEPNYPPMNTQEADYYAPPPQKAVPSALMDVRSVWGRMTTFVRNHESMSLYNLVGGHTDYELIDDTLVIYSSAGNFEEFADAMTLEALSRALLSDGVKWSVVVKKKVDDSNMDDEISKIKKLIGKAKLNIIK